MSVISVQTDASTLTKADFATDQLVRWCPGCGDYSILAAVQKVLPELGIAREKFVFVSGIGCSSRFPYYMNTYGFHTIHGRAPAVATGIKLARPDLSVWVVTGDGDGLSIGANHLLHILRRNLDVNILLVNNQIYGLTKGQYSPTSTPGKVTKSSPMGSIEAPVNPLAFAAASGATFIARCVDVDAKNMQQCLLEAARHKGTSFVEIYQNCHIFNDGAYSALTRRGNRDENALYLKAGEPLVFGAGRDKAVVFGSSGPRVVAYDAETPHEQFTRHDEQDQSASHAYRLAQLQGPDFPIPLGILRRQQKPCYETQATEQIRAQIAAKGAGDLQALLNQGVV